MYIALAACIDVQDVLWRPHCSAFPFLIVTLEGLLT